MTRWIAPILSFTADELWGYLPGEGEDSVFLTQWYDGLQALEETAALNADFWKQVMAVKTATNKVLEAKRNEGLIGAALEAEVTLYCDSNLADLLSQLGAELRFALIVSSVTIRPLDEAQDASATELDGLAIAAVKSAHAKCARCWHHREDVGAHPDHEALCGRCVSNVEGPGEQRRFA